MNKRSALIICLCCIVMSAFLVSCEAAGIKTGDKQPEVVDVKVWTYYTSDQLKGFNSLVDEFNAGVGKEKGIHVISYNPGSLSDLVQMVRDSVQGVVGAQEMPDVFSSYKDMAYELDKLGVVADIAPYMTDDEWDLYVDSYIDDGRFEEGVIKLFPIAKSTEILVINNASFKEFAEECDISYDDLKTVEGITRTAEIFYKWTGGKAFFGRDDIANYFFAGAMELGHELCVTENGKTSINLDKEVARKLWDNYYIPFVKGYFSESGKFRTDDIKTGNLVAYVGSSSSANFFPRVVNISDTEQADTEMLALECPHFEGCEKYAMQQGAGMAVVKNGEEKERAAVEFLKWFTEAERNISFSVSASYLPVQKKANDMEYIRSVAGSMDDRVEKAFEASLETIKNSRLYTQDIYEKGFEFRAYLKKAMTDVAREDRGKVVSEMDKGASYKDALSEFVSDDYFEDWYARVCRDIKEFE